MNDHVLIHTAAKLLEYFHKDLEAAELAETVSSHAAGAAAAGVASGWIPGMGGVALATVSAGFVWSMYLKINKEIGLELSDNLVKTVATGVATNLASAAVGAVVLSTVLSLVPGIGSVGSSAVVGATAYGMTMASGLVYLKVLTNLYETGQDPTTMDAETLKDVASGVAKSDEVADFMSEAKKQYKK